ncbi:replication protein [Metabacillus fastidiosus]|uniref:replication protein n=1 Tax=Metabacillus fastidiosus TaxID=1458 RepID=UPI003D28F9A1
MAKSNTANNYALDEAKRHVLFHHHNSDGWITVAKKTASGSFQQYHYKPEALAVELGRWLGEDVYFSQNTFFKPQRNIENIRQLRSLYIDLDFYLFNYDPSWVLGKLEHEYFQETIPEPNILIFSGQGLVLIWLLEPVPYNALPLWQTVQNYLLGELKELGGDPKAADAARIFRMAGSVNSKNGAEVRAEYRHDHKYELRQIQTDFLPELNEVTNPNPGKKKPGRKKKSVQIFNTYKLHYARLMDVVKLVELRNYEVTGYRELICFLYRYWLCCYTNDPVEALNQAQMLNLQFTEPLTLREVEKATKSAEKAWEAKNNEEANKAAIERGYPGAGYNLKNSKIIDWLDITAEEMTHLQTIIDANEKRSRKRIANMKKRRGEGVKPREEYIKEQHNRTDDKLFKLQQLLEKNPKISNVKLGVLLGVSEGYIRKLKKQL